jgi:choline dehydrogenase-like flavoprotein
MAVNSVPAPSRSADVLVIGAGAGGAAAAWALARRGVKVILIDTGSAYDASDYKVTHDDWELGHFAGKPGYQGRYEIIAGQPLDPARSHLRNELAPRRRVSPRTTRGTGKYLHIRGVGGTTLHFTGWMHRLHPHSLQMNTRFGVAADWPVSYAELEPYYLLAEQMVGVAGPDSVPGRPRSAPMPLPAHKLSTLSQAVMTGGASLGMRFMENCVAAPTRPYLGRPECNYCGCCARGCVRGDKASADIAFAWPAQATGNCTILSSHTLVELERGDNDLLKAAIVVDASGTRHKIEARHYVLATGAIETPRLLLAMNGLGNESGQVGQNFMETLAVSVTGLHREPLGTHRGYPEDSICWDYSAPDSIEAIPGGALFFPVAASADYIGPARYAERLVEGIGTAFKRKLVESFGRAVGVGAICENLPNPGSHVSLSPSHSDDYGLPIARITSHLPELELDRMTFIAKKAEAVLFASGVDELLERYSTYEKFESSHVMGTCRMGNDPETSVVDARQRSHRWRNLWISDTSVFPSCGSGEGPSLTAHALSIRLADNMIAQQTGARP